jgi:predicted DCC family thiol-disulfide oxidoreductase YuxK
MAASTINNPVVLFDGICNLCSSSVQFIIRHDPDKKFRFASQQSEAGKKLLTSFQIPEMKQESIFLILDHQLFQSSEAVLLIAKELSGLPRLLYWGIYLPAALRDWIYLLISKNRYRWFGKKKECWLPDANISSLFLMD